MTLHMVLVELFYVPEEFDAAGQRVLPEQCKELNRIRFNMSHLSIKSASLASSFFFAPLVSFYLY